MRANMEAERGRHQLTKEAISQILGITPSTNSRYVRGASIPSDVMNKLSRQFNCSTDYLLGLDDQKTA